MIVTEFEMVKYLYSPRPICLKCMYNEMQGYVVYVAVSNPHSFSVAEILTATATRSLCFICAKKLA
jgi:hypothetical protein